MLTNFVDFIPLPVEQEVVDGMVCLISGWGLQNGTSAARKDEIMRQKHSSAQVGLVVKWPADACAIELKSRGYHNFNETSELCFGWDTTDTCEGDSGGPLVSTILFFYTNFLHRFYYTKSFAFLHQ